jgi:hypothetical protein
VQLKFATHCIPSRMRLRSIMLSGIDAAFKLLTHTFHGTPITLQANLGTAEQELQIFRTEAIHSNLVVVDRSSNHSCLLLLQCNHTRLNTILDAETGNDTRATLTDTMATIGRLPLSSGVPPSTNVLAYSITIKKNKTYGSTMNTLEASVRLSATPPALRDTRKTSTSGFVMK